MTFKPMKPETIERRRVERIWESEKRRKNLILRLKEKVKEEGPTSIFAEMLAEMKITDLDL